MRMLIAVAAVLLTSVLVVPTVGLAGSPTSLTS